jgi:5'-methylthioadenosine phosphorylase
LCTWHDTPGAPGRGHWIFGQPFSEPVRAALIQAGQAIGTPVRAGGCYGHVDGPRFSSRAEIAALARCGVTAVSQTAGPEVVLAGEARLPMALAGYVTDYANGVAGPEPVAALLAGVRQSTAIFAALVAQALPAIGEPGPAGVMHRFGP